MSHFGDLTILSLSPFLFFLLGPKFSSKFLNMMIYISTLQLQHMCPFCFHCLFLYVPPSLRVTFLRAFAKLRKATISFVRYVRPSIYLSVCLSAWNNSAPTGRIFMKFYMWAFFESLQRKFNFIWVRNISDKIVEKFKTNVLSSIIFFENSAAYVIVWVNIVQPDRSHMTIRHMRIACWITKAKDTHTHNMYYLMLCQYNKVCTNASRCYVLHTTPVLSYF